MAGRGRRYFRCGRLIPRTCKVSRKTTFPPWSAWYWRAASSLSHGVTPWSHPRSSATPHCVSTVVPVLPCWLSSGTNPDCLWPALSLSVRCGGKRRTGKPGLRQRHAGLGKPGSVGPVPRQDGRWRVAGGSPVPRGEGCAVSAALRDGQPSRSERIRNSPGGRRRRADLTRPRGSAPRASSRGGHDSGSAGRRGNRGRSPLSETIAGLGTCLSPNRLEFA
jgi:hypothetical protein